MEQRQPYLLDVKLLCRAEVKVPVMEYLKGKVMEEYENETLSFHFTLRKTSECGFHCCLALGTG